MTGIPSTALIVDDDPVARTLLRAHLSKLGFDCVEVESGNEALAFLASERPALVTLDINMPQMDGVTFLRVAEQAMGLQDLPVLVVSAAYSENSTEARHLKRLGAAAYVSKPFRHRALVEAVIGIVEPPRPPAGMLTTGSAPRPRYEAPPAAGTSVQQLRHDQVGGWLTTLEGRYQVALEADGDRRLCARPLSGTLPAEGSSFRLEVEVSDVVMDATKRTRVRVLGALGPTVDAGVRLVVHGASPEDEVAQLRQALARR